MKNKQREWKNYKRRGLLRGDRETDSAKNAFKHKPYVTDVCGYMSRKYNIKERIINERQGEIPERLRNI